MGLNEGVIQALTEGTERWTGSLVCISQLLLMAVAFKYFQLLDLWHSSSEGTALCI